MQTIIIMAAGKMSGQATSQHRAGAVPVAWITHLAIAGAVGSLLAEVKRIPGTRCFASVCQHGYTKATEGSGTSFLVDLTRRKVVRIVVSAGR